MTTFDEREAAFEAKFAHDATVEFRTVARANRLLGVWAAGRLGLADAAAEDYARTVVHADFKVPGHEDVIEKVAADLAVHGVTEADVHAAYEAALAEARRQTMDPA
ncbi:MAG: DUF1476 domain-containing protein [Sphingomonadaceae bacterium]|nr:DUF1476 domain-containing protein [Sphingomonadaceae bacterium]